MISTPSPSRGPSEGALVLALDTASPAVSAALGRAGEAIAVRSIELRKSSEHLLRLLDEVLKEAGATFAQVEAVVALAGPGSFTGLRVGMATALGLHQATGVAVAAVPTLAVLAVAAEPVVGTVWAAVDSIRGEWFAQPFETVPGRAPRELAPPRLLTTAELVAAKPATLVGFQVGKLRDAPGLECIEPAELASAALRFATLAPPLWDPAGLTRPFYLRAPEVSLPAARGPRELSP